MPTCSQKEACKHEKMINRTENPIIFIHLPHLSSLTIKMKRILILMWICCLTALVSAKVYTVENLPNIRLQDKTRYVLNPEGILSPYATATIDSMLYALEQKTGIETVVAVLPSIGNEDCFDFAFRLGSQWGVGKKKSDNGLVILLVTDQRCIQMVTGYGLEGDLPDAICKRIQTKYMIPYLREGDWDKGMVAGVKAVCARLDGSMSNEESEEGSGDFIFIILGTLLLILLGGGFTAFKVWRAKKCPYCGKHKLMRTDSHLVSRKNGIKTEDITYTCQNCGQKTIRRRQSYDENFRGPGGKGPFIGGMGGGFGSSGRGFGGGSFGGGSFGGGGSGSRF